MTTDSATAAPIQCDMRPTAGARNKNQELTRVRGSTYMTTITELAFGAQVHAEIEQTQKQRFADAHARDLPPVDQHAKIDAEAKCESLCFHQMFGFVKD